MKKRIIKALAAFAAVGILLSGCGGKGGSSAGKGTDSTSSAQEEAVLHLAMKDDLVTLDTQKTSNDYITPMNVFDTLFTINKKADGSTEILNSLDKPLPEQFLIYLAGVVRGDLGRSYNLSRPVADLIAEAFPGTLRLALAAALFAWCFGITAGVISAVFDNRLPDFLCMGVSLLGVSVPVFMVALTLQYLLYFKLGILPLTVDGTIPSLIMPAIALGWNSAGNVARLTRSSLIEQKSAPYIETAMAKGLTRRAAIVRHGLKNAFLPVLTLMALQLSDMLSGAVITETIFGIPGLGKLSLSAALTRDMPLLQGTVLFSAFLIAAGSVIADFLNTVLDPRIRE